MALFPLQIPWTQKPPLCTPIDWSNPLAQGLVGAYAYSEGGGVTAFDAVTGKMIPVSGLGPFGATVNYPLGVDTGIIFGSNITVTTACTITSADCAWYTGTGGGTYHQILNSGSNILLWFRGIGSSDSGIPFVNKQPLMLSRRGSTWLLAHNGKTFSVVNANSISGNVIIGNVGTVNGGAAKQYQHFFVHNRSFTATEAQLFIANPWQIYQPQVMWVELGGGGVISFTGDCVTSQVAQSQALAGILGFVGDATQSQIAQSQILSALLSFTGDSAQSQTANTEAIAAILGFSGAASQQQAIQTEALFQALVISGAVSSTQSAQIASLAGSLAFGGTAEQTQTAQSEALAAVLSFTGNSAQSQAEQVEALSALLTFGGDVTQAQAVQTETLLAILAFTGGVNQTQARQMEAVSDYVARLRAILTITARDPLALNITARDPLELRATVRDPLALIVTAN